MKLKNILCAAVLSVAVAIVFCGCGPAEEEVYEFLGRVEQKQKKIKEANLSMDQGFQEKLDLLERQFTSANRAFSKGDYSATVKFLQEAEASGVALQTFCSPLKKILIFLKILSKQTQNIHLPVGIDPLLLRDRGFFVGEKEFNLLFREDRLFDIFLEICFLRL